MGISDWSGPSGAVQTGRTAKPGRNTVHKITVEPDDLYDPELCAYSENRIRFDVVYLSRELDGVRLVDGPSRSDGTESKFEFNWKGLPWSSKLGYRPLPQTKNEEQW